MFKIRLRHIPSKVPRSAETEDINLPRPFIPDILQPYNHVHCQGCIKGRGGGPGVLGNAHPAPCRRGEKGKMKGKEEVMDKKMGKLANILGNLLTCLGDKKNILEATNPPPLKLDFHHQITSPSFFPTHLISEFASVYIRDFGRIRIRLFLRVVSSISEGQIRS